MRELSIYETLNVSGGNLNAEEFQQAQNAQAYKVLLGTGLAAIIGVGIGVAASPQYRCSIGLPIVLVSAILLSSYGVWLDMNYQALLSHREKQ